MTQGYIRPSLEHLRDCVIEVVSFLEEKMGERWDGLLEEGGG